MRTLSLSVAKSKLGSLVDSVERTGEEITITSNGRPVAVLISPRRFDGWNETVAVRNDASLMAEIAKGRKALKAGKTRLYTLAELFDS